MNSEIDYSQRQAYRRLELTGVRFGRLTAVQFHGTKSMKRNRVERMWVCKCDCGNERVIQQNNLRSGHTKSCGCLEQENRERLNALMAETMKRILTPEIRRQNIQSNPRSRKGPEHHAGRIWRLRSPLGRVFEFKNLQEFVRVHRNLFQEDDLIWKGWHCPVTNGLSHLSPRIKHPVGNWKGWTWYSQTERLKNEGNDLLDRKQA